MSSKFFSAGSDSESASEADEGDEVQMDERVTSNRFVYSSSESEDEGKRVVRSEKDKRLEELRAVIKNMKNHVKIGDWVAIQKDFDLLGKAIEKAKGILTDRSKPSTPASAGAANPFASLTLPPFILSSLYQLQQSQSEAFQAKDTKKKMSAPNAKALNTMKQRMKKFLALIGPQWEKFIADPKLIADAAKAEREEMDAADVEEKEEEKKKKRPAAKKIISKKKEVSDEENDEEEEEDEEDEDEDDDEPDSRAKFTKKTTPPKSKTIIKKKQGSEDEEDEEEDEEEEEDEDDEDEESEEEAKTKKKAPPAKKAAPAKKEKTAASDEDDEEEEDEEDEDEEEDDDEEEDEDDEAESSDDEGVDITSGSQAMFTREFWVKKDVSDDDQSSDSDTARQKKKAKDKQRKKKLADKEAQASITEALKNVEMKQKAQAEMSPEQVVKKLKELLAMRGKRGTDKLAMITDLKLLASKATEPAALLKVHTTLTSALFDVTLNKQAAMPTALWKECYEEVMTIINLLDTNDKVRLSEDEKVEERFDEDADAMGDEEEKIAETTSGMTATDAIDDLLPTNSSSAIHYVTGNLFSFLQLLFMDYRKSMQQLDFHSEEYVQRLKDEWLLEGVVTKAMEYYKKIGKVGLEASVAFLRLELVYYKYNEPDDALKQRLIAIKKSNEANKAAEEEKVRDEEKEALKPPPSSQLPLVNPSEQGLVSSLATFLYKHGSDQSRVRALLLHVYYLSLHNQYQTARDMLLMSHIHESVQHADIKTQVLFNRAICQLGLCAFRVGEFKACLEMLGDLIQTNKVRELLAQGTSQQRWGDRDLVKEELEKKRQLPFHMHIREDYIESTHLICALLVEVPNLAQHGQHNRKRVISKAFRRLYDAHSRQAFNGPPENTRDLIMAATRALRGGEWEKCMEYLLKLRMWAGMASEISEYVINKLRIKVQEEGLRTYLLTYSQHFQSISLDSLSTMFSLPATTIYRITSKMIVNEQLAGSWDQPTRTIIMSQTQPSKLSRSAAIFSERVISLVEQNEKMMESRHGFVSFGSKDQGMGERDVDRETSRGRGRGRGRGGNRGGRGGSSYTRVGGAGGGEYRHGGGNYRGGRGRGRGG